MQHLMFLHREGVDADDVNLIGDDIRIIERKQMCY